MLLKENLCLFYLMTVQVYGTRDALLHDVDDSFDVEVMCRGDACNQTTDCKEEQKGIDMHTHPLSNDVDAEVAVHMCAVHECV